MSRTLRVRREITYLAIFMCLPLLAGLWLTGTKQHNDIITPDAQRMSVIFISLIWGVFTAGHIHLFLFCLRHYCVLKSSEIIVRGFFQEQIIPLSTITNLKWPQSKSVGFSIVLQTEDTKIRIRPNKYSINERRHLILHLRRSIPLMRQEGWNAFGQIYGRPILRKLNSTHRTSKDDSTSEYHEKIPALPVNCQYIKQQLLLGILIISSGLLLTLFLESFYYTIFLVCLWLNYLIFLHFNPYFKQNDLAFFRSHKLKKKFDIFHFTLAMYIDLLQILVLSSTKNIDLIPFVTLYVQAFSVFILVCFSYFVFEVIRVMIFERKTAEARRQYQKQQWAKIEQRFRIADADLRAG